ncbi:hypothetical protein TcBrA4_0110610 [Trypanosoma cruzi]|nr:hypothetical protein TcBrA4_0110610 [Trypanosoma cruzi]
MPGDFRRSKPKFASLAADAESVTEGTQYGGGLPAEHRVVACISLIGGVTAAPSNQLESDILLRLMGHVTTVAEQPAGSLVDIMAWRVGVSLPLYPQSRHWRVAAVLMIRCDGGEQRLCIHDETYRRRIHRVRFPPQHAVGGGPLRIIVDGLFNRGLLLNGLFVEDGGIRVRPNGCPQYSLEECRRILQGLMRDGLPVMWHEASNRRWAHSSSIPYNAPIGCDLHGHMQTVHILVESQHARWGFFDSPQYCESFFF